MNKVATLLFLLFASCATAGPTPQLPTPLYPIGTSFEVPCQVHGTHTQTITANTVGIVYTIEQDDGSVAQIPELLLQQVLEALGVSPSEEPGQQTPTDQVEVPAGPVQPPAGGDTSPTGNR